MDFVILAYIVALFLVAILMFLTLLRMFNVRELENDKLNPQDMCVETNRLVGPEMAVYYVLYLLFLVNTRWVELAAMTPLAVWNGWQLARRKHLLDVLTVFEVLPRFKRENFIRFAFGVSLFFVTLFRFVAEIVAMSDEWPDDDW